MKDPTPAEDQFAARLAALERAVSELSAARNLRSATIDDPGVLQVRTGNIVTAMFGRLSDGLMGTVLRRQGGQKAFSVQGNLQDPTTQYVALWDRSGNIVVSDDATSGVGLATPWLHFTLGSLDSASYSGTQSAAFTALEAGMPPRTHPRLRVYGMVRTDVDTTGEVRLTVGGVQIGAVQVVEANAFRTLTFDGTWRPSGTEAFLSFDAVQIEARRTAGTGFIRFHSLNAYGLQS